MLYPGYDVYVIDQCVRIERTLGARQQAARAELRRLQTVNATPRHARLANWLGLRLVDMGTWLRARADIDRRSDANSSTAIGIPE